MDTINHIMALADEYARRPLCVRQDGVIEPREALRAAIEQALTPGEPVATWENTYGMKEWQVHALRAGWWPQPKQEPVSRVVLRDGEPTLLLDRDIKPTDQRLYTTPQPQPKQEPDHVAVHMAHCNQGEWLGVCKYGAYDCPALSAPQPQREWVGIGHTEEFLDIACGIARRTGWMQGYIPEWIVEYGHAIEAKLREKNGGGV